MAGLTERISGADIARNVCYSGGNISRVTSTPHAVREYYSSTLTLLGPWTASGNSKSKIKLDSKACPQSLATQFDKRQSIQILHTSLIHHYLKRKLLEYSTPDHISLIASSQRAR
jgi:hypothetical protein